MDSNVIRISRIERNKKSLDFNYQHSFNQHINFYDYFIQIFTTWAYGVVLASISSCGWLG